MAIGVDLILGITAGLLHLAAFGIYNKQVLKGESHPNAATWALWCFITTVNYLTYFRGWSTGIMPALSMLACVITFLLSLVTGHLKAPTARDGLVAICGALSILVWRNFHSAVFGNIIIQFAIMLSFLPTYADVWRRPDEERRLPWVVWCTAYVLLIGAVALKDQSTWFDYVYPVNGLLLHATVVALTRRRAPATG